MGTCDSAWGQPVSATGTDGNGGGVDRVRSALLAWMTGVLDERDWTAAAWARAADVTPTNLTRFLKDPGTASLPSAETIGRLAIAAGREPRFLDTMTASAAPARPGIPLLLPEQARQLRQQTDLEVPAFLDQVRRTGAPCLEPDPSATARAFAMRITSLHMNAGGWVPGDCVVLEPADRNSLRRGDAIVVLVGDQVCGFRCHPPLLVPASTDSACCPLLLDEAVIVGIAIRLLRDLRI